MINHSIFNSPPSSYFLRDDICSYVFGTVEIGAAADGFAMGSTANSNPMMGTNVSLTNI
jgi:hypothetical protein